MDFIWVIKYVIEFLVIVILIIFGNGVVVNVEFKGMKGY